MAKSKQTTTTKNKTYKIKLNGKNDTGRPPKYKTKEELIEAINDYFVNGVTMRPVITGKDPNKMVVEIPVPTLTGLCYYLGFASKQSFFDLQKDTEFSYSIKKARLFIEKEYEEQLQYGNTTGAIFALKNMGWIDRIDTNHSGEINLRSEADRRAKELENEASKA